MYLTIFLGSMLVYVLVNRLGHLLIQPLQNFRWAANMYVPLGMTRPSRTESEIGSAFSTIMHVLSVFQFHLLKLFLLKIELLCLKILELGKLKG